MPVVTLVWIGPANRFAASLAQDPRLDVVWEARPPATLPPCDAIVLDAAAPGADAVLQRHKPEDPPIAVLADEGGNAAGAPWLARGANAVLGRPAGALAEAALAHRLLELARRVPAAESVAPRRAPFITRDTCMREVAALARRAAGSAATVLIQGETGSGKEVVAREVHLRSARSAGPFVAMNCAALPDTLLESELFGHARGAFTGAERDRRGAFEEAHGGTLFLDEVGETSRAFQAKLLRVLQDRAVRPLGGSRTRRVDVRVVAATHRDLRREIRRGGFREDLYFRLAVFPIHVPPLRERPKDVIALAEHFLAAHGLREGRSGCSLGPAAGRLLLAHRWPGNVRELENEIQRALVLAEAGRVLGPEHFSPHLGAELEAVAPALEADLDEPLRETLARIEARLLRRALDRHGGRRAATARSLGLTREGLYKKMKRFGIE